MIGRFAMIFPNLSDEDFTLCPFWFWNDTLDERELARQIADFQAHGVHAFVIHPRVGLPRDLGWMSDNLLHYIRFAVEEAKTRGMWVVLYDEGMYPSGSSSGQVVAENPRFACRGLHLRPTTQEPTALYRDAHQEVVCERLDSHIRGLHYIGGGPEEDEPPAADLLNPDAVRCFIRKVYDRYAEHLGDHFGTTIRGIFTDEPSLLGRLKHETNPIPGTDDILDHVKRLTGEDLSNRLPELWNPNSATRRTYDKAIRKRLEETYYQPLSEWCQSHRIALMGHPERPDDLSALSYFDVPGQDLVWRWVLPGPSAIEGPQSTQAKAAASAAHLAGKKRNSNECAGAYGHELTFEEFKWLIDWCIVRGTNLFFPHAFYYSIRGPRKDERPPDVGPNSPWWDRFADFANYCARLCQINTEGEHVCEVFVRETETGELPWRIAKELFQNQIDFRYVPHDQPGLVDGSSIEGLPRTLEIERHPDVRIRHLRLAEDNVFIVHNENGESLDLALPRRFTRVDPWSLDAAPVDRLTLQPFELTLLVG